MKAMTSRSIVGHVYPATAATIVWNKEALVDRKALAKLSTQMKNLMSGRLVLTASPSGQAIAIHSETDWNAHKSPRSALSDAGSEQRSVAESTIYCDNLEPLVIPRRLTEAAGLSDGRRRTWLVCYGHGGAELMSESHFFVPDSSVSSAESPLIGLFRGEEADHRGRTLDQVLAMDDFWLEHTHDYIQWLFPIPEAGRFNGFAPVLDNDTRDWFAREPELRQQQRRALDRMLAFLGLARQEDRVVPRAELNPRDHIWLKRGGHNQLRITRMIRSLHYCHQPMLAKALQESVIVLGRSRGHVQDETIGYWRRAID